MIKLTVGFLLLAAVLSQNTLLSWRDTGYISIIDTMGTCRASWVFAATSHYESAYLKWGSPANYTNLTIDFSEQYLLECSLGGDCSGGNVSVALSFALSNGMPSQADYAYAASSSLYGIPLTNTSGASCTTMIGKLKKVHFRAGADASHCDIRLRQQQQPPHRSGRNSRIWR